MPGPSSSRSVSSRSRGKDAADVSIQFRTSNGAGGGWFQKHLAAVLPSSSSSPWVGSQRVRRKRKQRPLMKCVALLALVILVPSCFGWFWIRLDEHLSSSLMLDDLLKQLGATTTTTQTTPTSFLASTSASCFEFQSLFRREDDPQLDKELQQLCPRSNEGWGCRDSHEALQTLLENVQSHQHERNQTLAQLKQQHPEQQQDTTTATTTLLSSSWDKVVILLLTYHKPEQNQLLRAHFESWIPHTGPGLDLVLVTDESDPRTTLDEFSPLAQASPPNIHIYKSPALHEGKRARYKVADALQFAAKEYVWNTDKNNNHNATTSRDTTSKQFFFKMDPDTFLFPHHLRRLLQIVDQHPLQLHKVVPLQFGLAMCHDKPSKTCHAGGGLYGFNRLALDHIARFFAEQRLDVLFDKKARFFPPKRAHHEDFCMSFALKNVTQGVPMVNCGGFYSEEPAKYWWQYVSTHNNPSAVWVPWPLTPTPVSFHKIRNETGHRLFSCYVYQTNNRSSSIANNNNGNITSSSAMNMIRNRTMPRPTLPYEDMFRQRNIC